MKISIIIATYNAGKTLRNCLDSIVSQLTEDIELIIVDGGSKDDTNAIVDSYGDKVSIHISEPDKGIYDAWNKGVKVATGDWVMFVGADDSLIEGALEHYLDITNQHGSEGVDFVSAMIKSVTQDGKFIQYTNKLWSYKRCRINMDTIHSGSLTSKRYFERVGLFDIKYKICGDYDLLMRGGKDLKAIKANKPILQMPIGGASFSIEALMEQLEIKHNAGHVSYPLCYLILLGQIFLFYTYTLRHWRKG